MIIEVDPDGGVVDDFRLYDILDPYRDTLIKALDQGAVCLNIDPAKAGQTLSYEESRDFIIFSHEFAEAQVLKAGYRLAVLLNRLFG